MISHIVFDHDGTLVNTSGIYKKTYAGVKELLQTLSSEGFSLYVWTARDRASTQKYLKNLEILHIFKDISTATDCEAKPNPAGLHDMLGGIDPHHVLHIGDSYTDVLGAKNFGCRCIGAIWAHNTSESRDILNHCGADFICDDPLQILDIVNKLNKKG